MSKYSKTPTIYQMEATECGAACLSMIFSYYGKNIPLEKMRVETGVSRDGCSAGNMMRAAKKYGLGCRAFQKEIEELIELDTPSIIHWNFNHFVVYEGRKGKYYFINDPAMGRRKLTLQELDDAFTGIVLTFKCTENFIKEKKQNSSFEFVKKRVETEWQTLFKMIAIGFCLVFFGVFFPILSQIFLDEVLVAANYSMVNQLLLFMFAVILLQAVFYFYRNTILNKLQNKMILLSAREFLEKLFRLPISFFDQRYVGDLVQRVDSNTSVNTFLSGQLAQTVLNSFIVVFYLGFMFMYSVSLTLIVICAVLLNVITTQIILENITDKSMKLQQDKGKLFGVVCAGVSITSTIKASGAEQEYTNRILGHYAKTVSTEQKLGRYQQIVSAIPEAIKMLSDVFVLLVGAYFVIKGDMTIGMLVAFTTIFASFSEPLDKLVGFAKEIQSLKADINRVEDIMKYALDEKFDIKSEQNKSKTKVHGSVRLQNVSFGYSSLKPPLIEDFTCEVGCGTSIAFVGMSGCGKSTVANIISGLYKPWSGKILFDEIDTQDLPNSVLNASISTVSQNITLFSGTIRENLTMWNDIISEKDMIEAAKDACIHDVITKKPNAYDFVLTEGASNLSKGQRQRLEIARALVTNPTILVMDEATSALDPVVEKTVLNNIKRRGCTCIIVAHRLSAIRDCDNIVVMKNGKIIQCGTHEQLEKTESYYKKMLANV